MVPGLLVDVAARQVEVHEVEGDVLEAVAVPAVLRQLVAVG